MKKRAFYSLLLALFLLVGNSLAVGADAVNGESELADVPRTMSIWTHVHTSQCAQTDTRGLISSEETNHELLEDTVCSYCGAGTYEWYYSYGPWWSTTRRCTHFYNGEDLIEVRDYHAVLRYNLCGNGLLNYSGEEVREIACYGFN